MLEWHVYDETGHLIFGTPVGLERSTVTRFLPSPVGEPTTILWLIITNPQATTEMKTHCFMREIMKSRSMIHP